MYDEADPAHKEKLRLKSVDYQKQVIGKKLHGGTLDTEKEIKINNAASFVEILELVYNIWKKGEDGFNLSN